MPHIAPDQLRSLARDIFVGGGVPLESASQVADSLVDANLAGHDSHGVIRVPSYVQLVREGRVMAIAQPELVHETSSTGVVDGHWAFGQLTARQSMAIAIAKAKDSGVAAVSAVACNHIGRLGEWVEMAAAEGLIGFATVSMYGLGLAAAPHGGAGRAMSTNPIAFGVPSTKRGNVVTDFATTTVAEGKLQVARAKGVEVPPGCILDAKGQPSTSPQDFYDGGALLPFGAHKGYGLAVVSQLLSLALTGALGVPQGEFSSGAFFLCIDPGAFGARAAYSQAADYLLGQIKSVPPAPGFDEVLLPGEPEQRSRAARAEGIPIDDVTWAKLQDLQGSLGPRQPTGSGFGAEK
ncbi:MAG: Ldh family oxidoreductase [Chloroflexota bacterium]